jgi:hypothetical protein
MSTLLAVILIFGLVGGIIFVTWQFNKKRNAEAATWPSVKGEIRYSATEEVRGDDDISHSAAVQYNYVVDGKPYVGNRILYGNTTFSNPRDAQKLCDKYPVGATVDVYYDPKKPSRCVLERKAGA